MKTAMQELIDYVDSIWSNEGWEETIKEKAKELLEKEKEQMVDFAFNLYNALSDLNQVPKNLVTENNNIVKRYFEHIFSDQDKYFEQAVESNKKQQNK